MAIGRFFAHRTSNIHVIKIKAPRADSTHKKRPVEHGGKVNFGEERTSRRIHLRAKTIFFSIFWSQLNAFVHFFKVEILPAVLQELVPESAPPFSEKNSKFCASSQGSFFLDHTFQFLMSFSAWKKWFRRRQDAPLVDQILSPPPGTAEKSHFGEVRMCVREENQLLERPLRGRRLLRSAFFAAAVYGRFRTRGVLLLLVGGWEWGLETEATEETYVTSGGSKGPLGSWSPQDNVVIFVSQNMTSCLLCCTFRTPAPPKQRP